MSTILGRQRSKLKSRSLLPNTMQIVLFSATFPNKVVAYAQKFAPNANEITLRHEELTVEGIKQLYLDCPGPESKYDILVRLYSMMTIGSSIIFVAVCILATVYLIEVNVGRPVTLLPRSKDA